MYSRCPHCQTTFRVTAQQLGAANGRVRCGKCHEVFDAHRYLIEEPTAAPVETKKSPPPPIAPPSPQVDWLQDISADELEHVDLGGDEHPSVTTEDEETDHVTATTEFEAYEEPEQETEVDDTFIVMSDADTLSSTETEDRPAVKEISTTSLTEAPSPSLESDHGPEQENLPAPVESAEESGTSIEIPGHFSMPAIEPAYEDDRQLTARDEQGIDHLMAEVERQLQTDSKETDEAEATSFDSLMGYLEQAELEHRAVEQEQQTAGKDEFDFELSEEYQSKSSTPSSSADSDEIPLILRSSMQALEQEKRSPVLTVALWLVILLLLAALGLQAIVFRSYEMASQWPGLQSWLTVACEHLPCVYSGRRDPRLIQLQNRDVRVHPKTEHALLISATLLNQARYAQPYPGIRITLSDLTGTIVAERRFSSDEYLKDSESPLRLMRPDVPVIINLEVLDPGSEAVNFEFSFF